MDAIKVNRPCELSQNEELKQVFEVLQYRLDLWNEQTQINNMIRENNIDEETFKSNYFTQHFDWVVYFFCSLIIGSCVGVGTWIVNSFFLGLLLFVATFFVLFGIGKALFWKKNQAAIQQYREDFKQFKVKEPLLMKKLEKMKEVLASINDYLNSTTVLPPKYQDYWGVLLEYFQNSRADTLKEAINLLEHELAMQRQAKLIERQNYEIQRLREQTAQGLRDVENSVDINSIITSMKR